MTKIKEKEVQEIIELRRNSEALHIIAAKYNITGERVRQIIVKYNATAESPVLVRGKRHDTDKIAERRQKVAELRQSGMTLQKIAKTLAIPTYTVVKDCRVMQKESILPERIAEE
jgi:hypothetical protein